MTLMSLTFVAGRVIAAWEKLVPTSKNARWQFSGGCMFLNKCPDNDVLGKERDRQTDRQRQTERQTDRNTERDRQRQMQKQRQTDRQTEKRKKERKKKHRKKIVDTRSCARLMKEDKNSASIRPAARFFSKLESDFDNLAVPAGSVYRQLY